MFEWAIKNETKIIMGLFVLIEVNDAYLIENSLGFFLLILNETLRIECLKAKVRNFDKVIKLNVLSFLWQLDLESAQI